MRLWRESRAARGGLRLRRRGRSRACPPAVGWWGASHSLPCRGDRPVAVPGAGPLTLSGVEGSSGEWPTHRLPTATFPSTPHQYFSTPACPLPSSPPLSTKTRGRRMCAAYASASVLLSPSPLTALRERGTKGERVPRPMAVPAHPEANRRACPESLQGVEWRWPMHRQPAAPFSPTLHQSFWTPTCPLPSSPPPSNELEAEVGALAPTSASVLLSPSPLKALRERGIKGERVPRPRAEPTHPEQSRRVERILGGPPCRTDYAVTPRKA